MSAGSELREVMAHLATGVTVVSTRAADGSPLGTTVNSVTSVSLEPPLLLVCLDRGSDTLAGIHASGSFTVNVLAEHQRAISSRFARKGGADKTTGLELVGQEGSAPHLEESLAHLRCAVERCVEAGDHEIVIGEVLSMQTAGSEAAARPLLFFRGEYSRLHAEDGGPKAGNGRARARRGAPATTVAIVGGGFSGAVTAAQLLRREHPGGLRVVVVERAGAVGPGLAYSTPCLAHRLNVPAGQMSAYPDDPDHFLRWARRRDSSIGPASFVPRFLYGDYLEQSLAEAEAEATSAELERIRDEATGLAVVEVPGRRVRLALRSGREVSADRLVLANGNAVPAPPAGADPELLASDRYVADPWRRDLAELEGEPGPIVLLGTGLTMVDVALTLGASGDSPALQAISRHGLLPRSHRGPAAPAAAPAEPEIAPGELADFLPQLLVEAAAAADRGGSWREVIDSLRAVSNQIWSGLDEAQRRWFVSNLARLWEVHRHRMAPEVAMALEAMRASGRLQVSAGEIERAGLAADGGVELRLRSRAGGTQTLRAARLVNCSGPATDVTAAPEPLLHSLLDQGLARPDALRLGLDVDESGALRDAGGESSPLLFALGPLRKGSLWETTAVPELRVQAEELAAQLSALAAAAAPGGERSQQAS